MVTQEESGTDQAPIGRTRWIAKKYAV